jgi:hypothetical protein
MNVEAMIKSLQSEKEALDAAILVLERLALSHGKRRGRPPAWVQVRQAEGETSSVKTRKAPRKGFSEETKRKMAEAQRRRWAAARKGKAS